MAAIAKAIQAFRADVAHFLRANIETARKPGHFLHRLAEIISPRTSFFHKEGEVNTQNTSLMGRKVTIPDQQATAIPAKIQFDVDPHKLSKARAWAKSTANNTMRTQDNNQYVIQDVVGGALREIERENPHRALALLEQGFQSTDNPEQYKQAMEQFVQKGTFRGPHDEEDYIDLSCAIELAYWHTTQNEEYVRFVS